MSEAVKGAEGVDDGVETETPSAREETLREAFSIAETDRGSNESNARGVASFSFRSAGTPAALVFAEAATSASPRNASRSPSASDARFRDFEETEPEDEPPLSALSVTPLSSPFSTENPTPSASFAAASTAASTAPETALATADCAAASIFSVFEGLKDGEDFVDFVEAAGALAPTRRGELEE
jgi:hypothetical protein